MKKILFFLFLLSVAHISKAQQNTDASKPTAVVSVVKLISDTFLPGVFNGIKGILDNIRAKNTTSQNNLDSVKKQITKLSTKSSEMRTAALKSVQDMQAYYNSESKDFTTINELYDKINVFSTEVNTLVVISDIMTNPDVGFSSKNAKIQIINIFKEAASDVVKNFNIDDKNFVSDNINLKDKVVEEKKTIDKVIGRINQRDLEAKNTFMLDDRQIENYLNSVAELKNTGTYKLTDIERSVNNIHTLLGVYLKDFSIKTNRISADIDHVASDLK